MKLPVETLNTMAQELAKGYPGEHPRLRRDFACRVVWRPSNDTMHLLAEVTVGGVRWRHRERLKLEACSDTKAVAQCVFGGICNAYAKLRKAYYGPAWGSETNERKEPR